MGFSNAFWTRQQNRMKREFYIIAYIGFAEAWIYKHSLEGIQQSESNMKFCYQYKRATPLAWIRIQKLAEGLPDSIFWEN